MKVRSDENAKKDGSLGRNQPRLAANRREWVRDASTHLSNSGKRNLGRVKKWFWDVTSYVWGISMPNVVVFLELCHLAIVSVLLAYHVTNTFHSLLSYTYLISLKIIFECIDKEGTNLLRASDYLYCI
uniref:Transmembrane protein n=1 Tax=Heterorhabditis bacteriophora TaxID=37862 RepID=A0A1I7X1R9_HETBA